MRGVNSHGRSDFYAQAAKHERFKRMLFAN
jgi:hypothetical protein